MFLAISPVENTTVFYNGSVVGFTLDMLLEMAKDFIKLLRNFKFWGNVSYFDFFLAISVMSIVIVYLVNIARTPRVETASSSYARRNRRENNRDKK